MAVTPNLGLHQWQAGDTFLRADFNTDFGKLDTAIGAGLKLKIGSFTPDNTDERAVVLGLRPLLLFVFGQGDFSGGARSMMGVAFAGACYGDYGNSNNLNTQDPLIRLTDQGFVVAHKSFFNYPAGKDTYYAAFY